MPCEIFFSQASQCVVLETPQGRRYYFDPQKGGGEWKVMLNALKISSDSDAEIAPREAKLDMPAIEEFLKESRQIVAEHLRRGYKPTQMTEAGKKKLTLADIGL